VFHRVRLERGRPGRYPLGQAAAGLVVPDQRAAVGERLVIGPQVCEFPYLNPVTGPFHVEGAEPGDTLAVHFVEIVPARDWAVSSTFPHFGALTGTHATATLHPPLDELVWRYDVDVVAGTVRHQARRGDYSVELPLDPMHGTAGVAPAAFESRMTIVPDVHGGNMDTPELRAGVTAYFGVNVPGALFALGDGHCRQSDGEVCGTAAERYIADRAD
jgi:acetamidase/formamidase